MFHRPSLLAERHAAGDFDCGKLELNTYLVERAMFNQNEGYARTYVVADNDDRIVGYYSICNSMISKDSVARQIAGHGAPDNIPVVLLTRLAIDRSVQGEGLGGLLLRHAFETAVLSAESMGSRAVMVHAIDEAAQRFCLHYGFRPAKNAEQTLLRSLKDIAASLAATRLGK